MHLGIKNFIGGPTRTLFGDGTYSGNIIQGGNVLQPQTVNWPPDQNTGGSAGSTNDNSTRVDISWSFPAGETVTHLGIYGTGAAFTALLYIMRRNSAGNYTNVASITATVAATAGWQFFPLPTAFAVPADAYTYHVGSYSVSQVRYNNVATLQAGNSGGQFVVGSTGALTESSAVTHMVAARYEQRAVTNCIYITGAATVAPDVVTGASAYSASNIVLDGSTASLSPSTNSKGLIGFVRGSFRAVNGAKAHINKLGKAGGFGNLTALDLAPISIIRKLKPSIAAYVVQGKGALGAPSRSVSGNSTYKGVSGTAAGSMQTGGGGEGGTRASGSTARSTGNGGRGGPCCGGGGGGGNCASGGTVTPDYGVGGAGATDETHAGMGGAGDPRGESAGAVGTTALSDNGGGGLFMLFTPVCNIHPGCVVSADGGDGAGHSNGSGGGATGGGCVVIVTALGGYKNLGTVRASGGGIRAAYLGIGGPGGAGSVNIFEISA